MHRKPGATGVGAERSLPALDLAKATASRGDGRWMIAGQMPPAGDQIAVAGALRGFRAPAA